MRDFFTALYMSLKMFTVLPLPQGRWEDALRRRATACLPLVGLVLGGLWWGLSALARTILPGGLAAALVAALPFLLTGFMHLDGFMDASDAMLSWREREARLKILKDVHVGSFSVVALGLLFMFQFGACLSLKALFPLLLIPLISRAGSALSVMLIRPLGHSQYAAAGEDFPAGAPAVALTAIAALILLAVFGGARGLLSGLAAMAGYAAAMLWCVRTLGGVSGDLCGYALTISELCGLIALAI